MEYDWVGFGYAALVASGGIIGYARAGRAAVSAWGRVGSERGVLPFKGAGWLPACLPERGRGAAKCLTDRKIDTGCDLYCFPS